MPDNDKSNISSAEMTALWRSKYPDISGDETSHLLCSEDGRQKADDFIRRFAYPLIDRKVSVRAGFFLMQAKNLLESGKFDACISLASGFSLLVHTIAKDLSTSLPQIKYYDTDLDAIIRERIRRLKESNITFDLDSSKVKHLVLNLEYAYINNIKLRSLFPECSSPLFLIEGVIYFLSSGCVKWLLQEIGLFRYSAVIIDTWRQTGRQESSCFALLLKKLDENYMAENITSYHSGLDINRLAHSLFSNIKSTSISEAESLLSEDNKLIDQNEFYPVDIIVAKNPIRSKL